MKTETKEIMDIANGIINGLFILVFINNLPKFYLYVLSGYFLVLGLFSCFNLLLSAKTKRSNNKIIMTGIELITKERFEQLEKHRWDGVHDDKFIHLQLKNGAIYSLTKDENWWPSGWDEHYKNKIQHKNYKERLIVAGALIAAELDRLGRTDKK